MTSPPAVTTTLVSRYADTFGIEVASASGMPSAMLLLELPPVAWASGRVSVASTSRLPLMVTTPLVPT